MSWTEDNFGNDGARQFLQMQVTRLVTTIHDIVHSPDRLAPDDDGESMLMPCIEVLAILCERYDVAPPKLDIIQHWHRSYLAAFEQGFEEMDPPAGLKPKRRRVIENTFHWLESLSESYHAE